MVLNQSRHKHEELAFAAERHFSDLVRNAADLYAVEQRRPFLSSVDGQSDMVDARGSRCCPRGARLLDQVDDRLPICVQPVAVHAKWWTRTLAQANDGAKETPRGFGVLGDDRCMAKLHGEGGGWLFTPPFGVSCVDQVQTNRINPRQAHYGSAATLSR